MSSGQAPNKTCLVCGAEYYLCPCHFNEDKFRWKSVACTPQHFQVFSIALDLRDDKITPERAKEMLANVGFTKSDLANVVPTTAVALEKAFKSRRKRATNNGEA